MEKTRISNDMIELVRTASCYTLGDNEVVPTNALRTLGIFEIEFVDLAIGIEEKYNIDFISHIDVSLMLDYTLNQVITIVHDALERT